jgi:hypothetical protein
VSAPGRVVPFVDGIGFLLELFRTELPLIREPLDLAPATVTEDIPDHLADHLPMVQLRRTGGASDRPRFYTQFWTPIQVWSDKEVAAGWDPHKAAFELGEQVARVLFLAWENQTHNEYGSITKWRESTGFRKFTDPELPHIGRYVATYDLLIRNPRTTP